VIGLALWLLLARAPDEAAPTDNPHFATAVEAWRERRWPEAADAFERAYEIDPKPEYVFARAQAFRFAGDCEQAVATYRRFIALAPPRAAIDEAREHIATCGGDPEPAPATSPPAPRVEPDAAPPVDPPIERRAPRRWWRDPVGHVLGWTGLAAAGVGTGFVVEASLRRQRADRADDEQGYRDARRGGATLMQAGIPLLSVGGALVIAAVIRFAVVGAKASKQRRAKRSP
jgi:tetratricopeptide (TPR) repeat protein